MKSFLLLLFVCLGLLGFSQPINDNPCNSIPLALNVSCNQTTGDNNGATASTGVPAPGCGNYAGGDVWFSVVCPASGAFTVTTYGTALNDCAMAVYSGNCASLALVTCTANGNGNMPKLNVSGTAGTTYYFRVWDELNDQIGAFDICATATATAPLAPTNQDCLNAIPVCQSTYNNPTSYSGTGNVGNEINTSISCLYSGEKNDVWYQFTVQNSGQLCFLIDPTNTSNDYDWALWNLTNANCSDIATNAALQVACNYSGQTGYTASAAQHPSWGGPNQNGNTGLVPNPNTANYQTNSCITVTAGQSFVLNISNFSSSANGYSLYFPPPGTAGMAVIYDNVPPVMNGLTATPACGGTQVMLNFSENVKCNTVSSGDFSLSGPGGPYTIGTIVGSACQGGSQYENTYLVNFTPAITSTGTYSLCLTSTAGSVADACNNLAAPACFTFAVAGPTVTAVVSNVNCNGASTGSISATATGGSGFTYQLNGGTAQASGNFTGLAAGTYTVKAIAGTGCTSSTVVTISQPTALTVNATPSAASCAGTGSISTTVSGGTAGYTYAWTPSGSGANPTGLPTGTYTVTVTDTKGCTQTAVATIGAAPTVTATFTSSSNQCLNGNSFTFTNTGTAAGTHTYSFSPAAGAPAAGSTANYGPVSFTSAGTYTVTHSVNNGGCVDTKTTTVIVFPNPTAVATASINATCGQSNGSFTITGVTNGTPTYNYSINGGAFSATTSTLNLPSGTYNISVRDANNCTYTTSINIGNTPGPTALTLTSNSASCGTSNGSINTPTVTGGTPTYSYSVNGGAYTSSPTLTGLAAGSYSITVKDANGCTIGNSTTIGTLSGPSNVNLTSTPTSCTGSTGTYSIGTVTGGTGPYTYSVSPGPAGFNSTTNFTGQGAGTYTVTVKDNGGCTFSKTVVVGGVSGPTSMTVTTGNASCGSANGTATVTGVTGGTPAYTYQMDGGAFNTPATFTGLTAGSHTVTVKDNNGCTFSLPITVGNNGSPTASVTGISNISCNAGTNGSFTVSASGGTTPFTYSINPGGTSNGTGVFTGLTAQSYTVTVKDAANCITTTFTTLTQPTVLTETLTPQAVSCNSGSNGTITATSGGGTAPYMYSLNGAAYQASGVYTGLTSGIYNVSIKDNNNCTISQTVSVTQPTALNVAVTSGSANCTASNGTATATPSGGTPGYTYTWTSTGGSSATSAGLPAGTYSVTVTDNNGCQKTAVATIGTIAGGTATISNVSNVSCFGANNGSLTVSMGGNATPPFTYTWSPVGGSGATATNLPAGNYTVQVKDQYNCTSTANATITEPTVLKANLTATAVSCYGGSNGAVSVTGQGGTPPYTYIWNPSASTSSLVTGLPVGSYTCTETDAHGCVVSNTVSIIQPSAITALTGTVAANCNQANGSANIIVSGGTPAYTYSWTTGATTSSITAVAAGAYSVQVKDAANCIANAAVIIPNLSGPTMTLTSKTDVSCNGGNNGTATYSVSGGSNPYVFHWSNNQVTPTATNLSAGLYTVSATDQNGCVASASVTITEPPLLVLNANGTNPKCFGSATGSATVGVLGGTPGYTYSWTGSASTSSVATNLTAGNYIVTVTDNKGCIKTASTTLANPAQLAVSITNTAVTCFGACNGSATATPSNNNGAVTYSWSGTNPQTTQVASGLCAGNYTVNISDQNGCTATGSTTISQPAAVTASITASGNVSCYNGNNGYATVTAGGGTPAYTYTWTNGGGNGSNANNLPANSYMVTVTDSHGCTASANTTITQPALFTAVATGTNVKCYNACDGKAMVNYTGGTGPYTFLWSPSLATTPTVNNLCNGVQNITVTDVNGCTASSSVTLTQPQQLTAATTATSSNCGQANGNACVNVSGGTAPLSYLWSNGITTSCNFNTVAGAYTVTVTDVNTCSVSAIANINDIAGPSVVITATTAVKCYGGSDGAATATVSGGVAPYGIAWSGGQTTNSPSNLNAGLHSITVTDNAGCVASASVQITQPAQLVSAIQNPVNITCNGLCNGSVTMLANGGTTPYNYSWNGGSQTSSTAVSLCAGGYTCIVTDANMCTTTQSVTLTQPQPLVIGSFSLTDVSCNGLSNGSISANATGGTPGYSYTWTPASAGNNNNAGNLAAGPYGLYVQDSKGCSTTGNYVISEPAPYSYVTSSNSAKCGLSNGSASIVNLNGGTQPYTYSWNTSPNQSGATASNLPAGTFTCIISDAHSCAITQTVTVSDAASPIIDSISVVQPLCFGQQNGQLQVYFHKGTPNYTFTWSNPISQTTQTVTNVGAGAYSVTVTDFYGCTAVGVVNVPQPNILVLNVSPDQTICYGQTTQIYGAAQGGNLAGGYTYTWNPSNLNGGGPHTVNPTTTTQYTVAVGDSKGCTTSPKVITVNVKPQLTAAGYSATACDKDSVSFTPNITSPGAGAPYTYAWNTSATTQAIKVKANAAASPMTYTVTVKDGCTIPDGVATFTLLVNPRPTGTFTANILQGCAPLTVTFSATSNAQATDTYQWSFGDNGTGSSSPVVHTYADSGKFTVHLTITSLNNCKLDTQKVNYIKVYPQPVAEFAPNPDPTSILDPTVSFQNQSQGAVSYFWNFGDADSGNNNISIFTDPTHSYEHTGEYTVFLVATSSHGCSDTAHHVVQVTPDFALYIPNAFTVDGNGRNDVFQPLGVGINEDNYRMDIFDRWGELIFTSNNFRKGWDGTAKGGSKVAKQDVYVYRITVYDLEGEKHSYVGHVTLLKSN